MELTICFESGYKGSSSEEEEALHRSTRGSTTRGLPDTNPHNTDWEQGGYSGQQPGGVLTQPQTNKADNLAGISD